MQAAEEKVVVTPAQLRELLETRFNRNVVEALPTMVKGMLSSLTEGRTELVIALMVSHARSDRKIDRLASSVGALQEKLLAQEVKATERDARMEQKLEQMRQAMEALQLGTGGVPEQGRLRRRRQGAPRMRLDRVQERSGWSRWCFLEFQEPGPRGVLEVGQDTERAVLGDLGAATAPLLDGEVRRLR